jgi:UDP-N-acetyl-D-glucosamine dehydrogenase
MRKKKGTVAVIGLGYVGLPLALLVARKGYEVIGLEKDEKKVQLINNGVAPFKEEFVENLLSVVQIRATIDATKLRKAQTIVICVPTPIYTNHLPDYGPVEEAARTVVQHVQKGQLIILESTVNPGACEEVVIPILESTGLKVGQDFYLAHCPERINPGDPVWNVSNIPRVVGGYDAESTRRAAAFYESVIDGQVKQMQSLKEAESVKVVENAFRNVNIAFVNELAMSFDTLGIDVVNVIDGAATKPFAFMPHYPGCGIGGHCIPVDPYYLIDYARKKNFTHSFLEISCQTNERMPAYTVSKLEQALKSKDIKPSDASVAVLGLSYKANVGDDRESPSYEVIRQLEKLGVKRITIFDPYIPHKSNVDTLEDAMTKVDAVLLTTSHNEFKKITPKLLKKFGIQIVIDGRNILDKQLYKNSGITYQGIGR